MKNIFWSLCVVVGLSFLSWNNAFAEATKAEKSTTKVCVDVKDKAGKPVKDAKGVVKQNCKEMKVHKKLEGTPVPVKK
jgi:predicted rRNA methylase YqxC with S4 and FtsJ domains